MNIKKVVFSVAALVLSCGSANAAIIDFESVVTDNFDNVIVADGYTWDFKAAGWWIGPADIANHPDGTSNGTSNLVAAGDNNGNASVTMTQVGNAAFDISGLDAATANILEFNGLTITGLFDMGGSISTTIDIDATFDGYVLAGFTNLASVTFSSVNSAPYNDGGFSIDNIIVDEAVGVSAPYTLSLIVLGLIGFGTSRRLINN